MQDTNNAAVGISRVIFIFCTTTVVQNMKITGEYLRAVIMLPVRSGDKRLVVVYHMRTVIRRGVCCPAVPCRLCIWPNRHDAQCVSISQMGRDYLHGSFLSHLYFGLVV